MSKSRPGGRRKSRKTKDRVLQARIPEKLDEELRERAEQLGLSVSSIVRNVLTNTFSLVEDVVADSAQIAGALHDRKSSPSPPAETGSEVIGWQEAVLNQNGVCDSCNAILAIGERGAVGVPVQTRPVLLCLDCLARLSSTDHQEDSQ
jgi:hypothetical protein